LNKRYMAVSLFVLLALFISACGARGGETWPGIAIDENNETIIVSYRKTVTSLNPDKSRNWIYEYEGVDFYAPALIDDGAVYIGDFDGRFHAIDRETGESRWVYEAERASLLFFDFGSNDRVIASAEVGGDLVFFGTERGIFALDTDSGADPEIAWSFEETDHSVWGQPIYVEEGYDGQATLFVGSLDKHLYALNAETGDLLWKLGLEGSVPGQPTLDEGRQLLYVSTLNRAVFAVDFDGNVFDKFDTEGWVWGGPTLDDGTIYFGDLDGYLYAVNVTDDGFSEVWKQQISEEALRASPVVVDRTLIIPSEDETVYAVGLEDQSYVWRYDDLEQKYLTNIVVTEIEGEAAVVLGTQETDRMAIALRVSDGDRLWEYKYEEKDN
jgi:outer membrane protein assembly factor BamB